MIQHKEHKIKIKQKYKTDINKVSDKMNHIIY